MITIMRKAATHSKFTIDPKSNVKIVSGMSSLQFHFFFRMAGGGTDVALDIPAEDAADIAIKLIHLLAKADTPREPNKEEVAAYVTSLLSKEGKDA